MTYPKAGETKTLIVEVRDLEAALEAAQVNKDALQAWRDAPPQAQLHLYQNVKDHCGICIVAQAALRLFGGRVGVSYCTIRQGSGTEPEYHCWDGDFSQLVIAYDNNRIEEVRAMLPVEIPLRYTGTSGSLG